METKKVSNFWKMSFFFITLVVFLDYIAYYMRHVLLKRSVSRQKVEVFSMYVVDDNNNVV